MSQTTTSEGLTGGRGGRKASPGDLTGRAKEQAARDALAADRDAQGQATRDAAAEDEQQTHGVFDPKSGEQVDSLRHGRRGEPDEALEVQEAGDWGGDVDLEDEGVVAARGEAEEAHDVDEMPEDGQPPQIGAPRPTRRRRQPGFPGQESEPVYTGKEPLELQIAPDHPKGFSRPGAGVVRPTTSRVRIDSDIEDMTFGMVNGEPNNFSFREGFVYDVSTDLADHLAERGLIRQWIN